MKASNLVPEDFISWRRGLGLSQTSAARMLGVSIGSIYNYESGQRTDGRKVIIPALVALGMNAISNNLKPYEGERNDYNPSNS